MATTYTNILLLAKEVPEDHIAMCRIKDDYDVSVPLDQYVANNLVTTESSGASSWITYDAAQYHLIKKIEAQGKQLKKTNVSRSSILRSIDS